MFKSIFIKYIIAFLVIITLSFSILAMIISASLVNYSVISKQESIVNVSIIVKRYIEDIFWKSSLSKFEFFVRDEKETLPQSLMEMTKLADDSFIFITDTEGNILMSTPNSSRFLKDHVSADIIKYIKENKDISKFQTLGDLFESRHLVYPIIMKERLGKQFGISFVCSTSATINEFVDRIISTIILSCLWVLVATMVIIYFITEKIVSPLRTMSKAAKQFGLGHFDVHIPVRGSDEVAELAAAFNNMASSLKSREEHDRSFLANVSHDLRTPMTSIAGYIDSILDGTIPKEKQDYYLEIITTEIRRLSRLVTSMLDITRIQAGERKFNITVFDVCETARRVLISFEQRIESKKIEIEFEFENEKMNVSADADAIYQIMYNLVENAIKFTRVGGLIRVEIKSKEKKVQVIIYNTGDGIEAEHLPYVFDRFYKSDSSRGLDKSGVGLGLFIVKTIIEAHGEKIQVESEHGKYCSFKFTLPKIIEQQIKK